MWPHAGCAATRSPGSMRGSASLRTRRVGRLLVPPDLLRRAAAEQGELLLLDPALAVDGRLDQYQQELHVLYVAVVGEEPLEERDLGEYRGSDCELGLAGAGLPAEQEHAPVVDAVCTADIGNPHFG